MVVNLVRGQGRLAREKEKEYMEKQNVTDY